MITSTFAKLCLFLGACFHGKGISFRVFSQRATRLEVCLFREPLHQETTRCFELRRERNSDRWSAALNKRELAQLGFGPGQPVYYGYRAWGPNWPYVPNWRSGTEIGFISDVDAEGNRFNPNKLLFDPRALDLSHGVDHLPDMTVFETGPLERSRDSAPFAPKGIVLPPEPKWAAHPKPRRPLKDDVIYEVHVKSFTQNNPLIPPEKRGTFEALGLMAPYLKDLGITALELLPIHAKVSPHNNPNYWGYSTLSYFALERSYAYDQSPGGPAREFRRAVDRLHAAGIKVILDVVYNHTGEGGSYPQRPEVSQILSLRGFDNKAYYETSEDNQTFMDNTGCGANVATYNEPVRDLIMDSLKYAVDELLVDGFRFDLVPVLGNVPRNGHFYFDGEDPRGVLKRAVAELPVRPAEGGEGVDLSAEPWGLGPGTFVLGRMPKGWAEWNAYYRDAVRSFYNKRGVEPVTLGAMANAVAGSSALFEVGGRRPWSSINFLTAHDGFTLHDLFRFNHKVNNRKWPYGPSDGGEDHNRSWDQNGDPVMQRQITRTAMMTLLLSAGTPLLNGGDEFGRTLRGNNNPWNLDSVANYLQWDTLEENLPLWNFVQFLLKFRAEHPALRPADFYTGQDHNKNGLKDITWYSPEAHELSDGDFQSTDGFFGYRLDATEFRADSPVRSIYIATNAGFDGLNLRLPPPAEGHAWFQVADTAAWFESKSNFHPPGKEVRLGQEYYMHSRCQVLLVERAEIVSEK